MKRLIPIWGFILHLSYLEKVSFQLLENEDLQEKRDFRFKQ